MCGCVYFLLLPRSTTKSVVFLVGNKAVYLLSMDLLKDLKDNFFCVCVLPTTCRTQIILTTSTSMVWYKKCVHYLNLSFILEPFANLPTKCLLLLICLLCPYYLPHHPFNALLRILQYLKEMSYLTAHFTTFQGPECH